MTTSSLWVSSSTYGLRDVDALAVPGEGRAVDIVASAAQVLALIRSELVVLSVEEAPDQRISDVC